MLMRFSRRVSEKRKEKEKRDRFPAFPASPKLQSRTSIGNVLWRNEKKPAGVEGSTVMSSICVSSRLISLQKRGRDTEIIEDFLCVTNATHQSMKVFLYCILIFYILIRQYIYIVLHTPHTHAGDQIIDYKCNKEICNYKIIYHREILSNKSLIAKNVFSILGDVKDD